MPGFNIDTAVKAESKTGIVIDLAKEFERVFGGKPYKIPGATTQPEQASPYQINDSPALNLTTKSGSLLSEQVRGINIWLPIKFYDGNTEIISLPYAVIRISGKNNYVSTPMSERAGSVKELYSEDDYSISIKGFLINPERNFPEDEIAQLKDLKKKKTSVRLSNAITDIFLADKSLPYDEQCRVIVKEFDLPEVSGGRKHVRPFTMQLESDTVFTLELE